MSKATKRMDAKRLQQQSENSMKIANKQYAAVKDYTGQLKDSKRERLFINDQLREGSKRFLAGNESGKDITGMLPQQYKLMRGAADNAKRATEIGRAVGSRALNGGVDAAYQAQLDSQYGAQSQSALADSLGGIYENELTNQRNIGLGTEASLNADDYNILNAINGVSANAQGMVGLSNQQEKMFYDRPPSGLMQGIGIAANLGGSFAAAFCVSGATIIITERGRIPAKEVTVNDLILTRHPVSGAWFFDEIEEIDENQTNCLQPVYLEETHLALVMPKLFLSELD